MNIRAKIFGGAGAANEPLLKPKRPKGAKAEELHSVVVARESRQRSDSRGEDRHRLTGERVRMTHAGNTHHVELINLSGGGAMIETDLELMLWERVDLHLGENGDVECAVRWIRDDRVGLEFAHETRLDCTAREIASVLRKVISRSFPEVEFPRPREQPARDPQNQPTDTLRHAIEVAQEDEHRSAPRHPLIWNGTLYHDFQTTAVRVRNISKTGAMIETATPVRIGAQPLLGLGDAVSLSATVQWVVGDQIGLSFNEPFDLSLLADSRPTVAAASWTPPPYLEKVAESLAEDEDQWGRLTINQLRQELEGFLKR